VDVGEVEFRLETGEAERIGVEHVSKAQKKSDGERTDADECPSPPVHQRCAQTNVEKW
jgi:hypothetical protein